MTAPFLILKMRVLDHARASFSGMDGVHRYTGRLRVRANSNHWRLDVITFQDPFF